MQHPFDISADHLCQRLQQALADLADLGEPVTPAAARALDRLCHAASDSDGIAAGPRVAVALADIHADLPTLVAALLADPGLADDAEPPFDHAVFERDSRADVQHLLAAIERMRGWEADYPAPRSERQREYWRRLLLAGARDARAVLIDLAYRLEGMRALVDEPDEAVRRQYAGMTLAVHAPIAHRLGLGQVKWELEDLAFRHLEPTTYVEIARLLDERRASREAYLSHIEGKLQHALMQAGIRAEVYGRPKHIYSIWGKMRRKQLSFEGLFDVRALRVQVDSVTDCYAALSVVHELFRPIPSEYDDYIARPKPNGYQSLHTAVEADEGKVVEIQIRTERMHAFAEYGVAAHWRYKGGGGGENPFDMQVESLRQGLSRGEIRPLAAPMVYAFTPGGELVELPAEATVLDFAYRIHTHLGHRCRGAKVNGQIAPLKTQVVNGDVVEVLTHKEPAPSREWAHAKSGFLRSASSRAKVRNWFAQFDREDARERGRLHCERLYRRFSMDAEARRRLLTALGVNSEEQLFLAVGNHRIATETLQAAARAQLGADADRSARPPRPAVAESELPPEPPGGRSLVIENQSIDGLKVTPAKCCQPQPGERVMAFLSRSQGYKLHRPDCRNLAHLAGCYPERVLPVEWPEQANG
ncbi:TGS domain-containing protein [Guyparkeria hydrothermalis]|uniref:RelA/SpoT family protein n=1 Tax=Guyparkeria hydrothermalis TaxID=923 RepID=UPI00201FFF0D|nr:TGS domain-containing protein [Guyparkeria hydrothermalis]MCL7745155.1 TGS domain-containing protein [Guyparkeria hydrothermalis]